MSLFEEIREIICQELKVNPEEVKPETSLVDDLGVDSLDSLELVMALEEEFGIEIPDDDTEKMRTVNDVVNYIENEIN